MELNNTHEYELQIVTERQTEGFAYPDMKGIMQLDISDGAPFLSLWLPMDEFGLTRPRPVTLLLRLETLEGKDYKIPDSLKNDVNWTSIVHDGKISCRESILLNGRESFHFYIRENKLVPCRTTNYNEYDQFVSNIKEK